MTREEEIIQASEVWTYQKPPQYSELVLKTPKVACAYQIGFVDGAVWADKHRWISVEEELPPNDNVVLCYFDAGESMNPEVQHTFARYNGEDWVSQDYEYTFHYVTHWMPMPAPPKIKKGEENMDKVLKIYLAGKISKCNWRQSMIDTREQFVSGMSSEELKSAQVNLFASVYVTGPFFLACDHGCYHGDGSHGLGANKGVCDGENFSPDEVISICTQQIDNADMVIAFINDDTCYGTLYELGMAKQMGKQIVTIFDNEERQRKMWFIANSSDVSMTMTDDCADILHARYGDGIVAETIQYVKECIKGGEQ